MLNFSPGWYDDGSGNQRWWDGSNWTQRVLPARPRFAPHPPPATASPPAGPAPEVSEIQPLDFTIPTSRIIVLAAVYGLFVIGGLYMLLTGGFPQRILGLVSIGFFGGAGGMALKHYVNNRVALRLEAGGMRPISGGFIPWCDVERVGVGYVSAGANRTKVLGIRLRNFDNYIHSLTPAQIKLARSAAKWGRVSGIAIIPAKIDPAAILQAAATGEYKDLVNYDLITAPQQSLTAQLLWSRRMSGGWDISLSPLLFSRAAAETIASIENYRRAALTRGDATGGSSPGS